MMDSKTLLDSTSPTVQLKYLALLPNFAPSREPPQNQRFAQITITMTSTPHELQHMMAPSQPSSKLLSHTSNRKIQSLPTQQKSCNSLAWRENADHRHSSKSRLLLDWRSLKRILQLRRRLVAVLKRLQRQRSRRLLLWELRPLARVLLLAISPRVVRDVILDGICLKACW